MNELTLLAEFLAQYGAHAVAAVFIVLYALERRERQATQRQQIEQLEATNRHLVQFSAAHSEAVSRLERALMRSNIITTEDADD